MRHFALFTAIATAPVLCPAQVPAVLGKCIVTSLSASDRHDLARWDFLSMAVHPEVKPLTGDSSEATQAAARKVGTLFTRTLRDRCPGETREAAEAGGPPLVSSAISFFTQLGVQELMSNKDVLAIHSTFSQFADREGIDRMTRGK